MEIENISGVDLASDCIVIDNPFGCVTYFKNDEHMVDQLVNNLIFEQEYILNVLSPHVCSASVIVDVGAHVGSHTVMYKTLNPEATVHAFEPQKMLYKLLCYNVNKNNLQNVYTYNNAVGEANYITQMNPYSTDGENSMQPVEYGTSTMYNLAGVQIGAGGEDVTVVSLDTFRIPACDFMKIDVEGYEPNVLLGAREMIMNSRPVISFEVNAKKSPNIEESSISILEGMGYDCHNPWPDNWLAIPK